MRDEDPYHAALIPCLLIYYSWLLWIPLYCNENDSTFLQVKIPNASNACSGFDEFGWTFFDLNIIHDEHKDDPVTVLQADCVSFKFFFFFNSN